MVLLIFLSTIACVLITTGAASGEGVMKAEGDKVSFRPDKSLPSPVSSIIWKHRNISGTVVRAIEWDEGEPVQVPNKRFKNITTLDEKTGQITISNLKVEHSGVYTIDINSKEQEQRFTLTVKERVPKPVIKIEPTDNPDVVYLRCDYSETIIWKNSAGETLTGSAMTKGQSITVEKKGNPEIFYTCTLDNGASKETSVPVYVRDLFKEKSGSGLAAGILIPIILIIIIVCILIFLYKRNKNFKERVDNFCTCFGGPKDKDPKLTGVQVTTSEIEHLNAKDEGQPAENSDVKEGEPGTADSNDAEPKEIKTNPESDHLTAKDEGQPAENSDENEGLKKEDKINEAKDAA